MKKENYKLNNKMSFSLFGWKKSKDNKYPVLMRVGETETWEYKLAQPWRFWKWRAFQQ